jgi:hypothetical protein
MGFREYRRVSREPQRSPRDFFNIAIKNKSIAEVTENRKERQEKLC